MTWRILDPGKNSLGHRRDSPSNERPSAGKAEKDQFAPCQFWMLSAVRKLIECREQRPTNAVLYKMNEVYQIADVITVLRDGRHVGTQRASRLGIDELITMMVGRGVEQRNSSKSEIGSEVLLEVADLGTEFLSEITFQLRAGEVLGVAGLVGAGRSELGAALFGLRHRKSGRVLLKGKKFNPSSSSEAIDCGFSLLPEDRRYQGIFPQMSVRENASIAVLGRWNRRDRGRKEAQSVREYQHKLSLTASSETLISRLSGGNQQKVILARWLLAEPSVLFLDEPTRGIDIDAKGQI